MRQNATGLSVGASPWTYTAPDDGMILAAATASLTGVGYTRNGTTLSCNGVCSGHPAMPAQISVYAGDSVTFTYNSAAPTLYFIQKPV